MWDLPRPGPEPVSPALAGRFSTTAPPRKPLRGEYSRFTANTRSPVRLRATCPDREAIPNEPWCALGPHTDTLWPGTFVHAVLALGLQGHPLKSEKVNVRELPPAKYWCQGHKNPMVMFPVDDTTWKRPIVSKQSTHSIFWAYQITNREYNGRAGCKEKQSPTYQS